ncbi:hypothetical protein HGB48_15815 [Actinomadura latina]|uniref:Uncharacterized protein n=1 Tax=Actinomadura latina TaxID=163603 RepID=A0A846YYQ9_9ACTN|nr:hypothetical protein [Actinomadura latina]NKZ05201.1 hypothetical protein [Actinomadura latina]
MANRNDDPIGGEQDVVRAQAGVGEGWPGGRVLPCGFEGGQRRRFRRAQGARPVSQGAMVGGLPRR